MRLVIFFGVVLGFSTALEVPAKPQLNPWVPANPVPVPVKLTGSRAPIGADRVRRLLCNVCHQLVTMIGQASETMETKAEVTQLMKDAVCSRMGSAQSLCNMWMDGYVPEVRRMLSSKMDTEQICVNTKLCSVNANGGKTGLKTLSDAKPHVSTGLKTELSGMITKTTVANDLRTSLCDYCIELIAIAKSMFMDKDAEAEVTQLLKDTICPNLSFLQSVCNLWIDHYVAELMTDLANKTDPRQFCIKSEYCPATAAAAGRLQQRPVTTRQLMRQISEENFLGKVFMSATSLPAGRDGQSLVVMAMLGKQPSSRIGQSMCAYCTQVLTVFKRLLQDPQAAADLGRVVKSSSCSVLNRLKSACEQWVVNHMPAVMAMIGSEINPTVWCINASLCKPTEGPNPSSAVVQVPTSSDGICDLCQMAVKELRQMLSDGTTRDKILQYIKDQVCTIVPEDKDKCTQAVDKYGPIVLQLLLSELDAATACRIIGLCPKTLAKTPGDLAVRGGLLGDSSCQVCVIGVMLMQSRIRSDNATKAHVLANLESWCIILPAPNRTACHDFLEKWAIEVLLDADANRFCQSTDLCPKPAAAVQLPRPASGGGRPLSYHGSGKGQAPIVGYHPDEEPML